MKRKSVIQKVLLVGSLMLIACDDDVISQADLSGTSDMSVAVDLAGVDLTGVDSAAAPKITAFVTSRDEAYTTGVLNSVTAKEKTVSSGIDTTLDPDTVMHVVGSKIMILNRFKNNLSIYDANSLIQLPRQIVIGGELPQDFLAVPNSTKIYVSFLGDKAHAIGIFDTAAADDQTPTFIADIPTRLEDTDGKPEAATLYFCKDKVYAALQDLDRRVMVGTNQPTGAGRIAIVDTTKGTDQIVEIIPLHFQNPGGISSAGSDCEKVWVAGSGGFGLAPDNKSGVEKVDLSAKTSESVFFGSADLRAVPSSIVQVSSSLGFITVLYDLQTVQGPMGGYPILARSKVISFDPTGKRILGDVSGKVSYIGFMKVSPDGQLWFTASNSPNLETTGNLPAGLYVGKADGSYIQSSPINVGQIPVAIDFRIE